MEADSGDRSLFPSLACIELMRRHLAQEHGLSLELWSQASFTGNVQAEAPLTFLPETPAAAEGFYCRDCPGRNFRIAPAPGLSAERIDHLALHDPELQGLLADASEAERAELVEAFQAEKQAAALLERHRKRTRLRTAKPQPAAQERRERAQAYLLAKYEEIGNVEEALWDLMQLRARDLATYRRVIGSDQEYKLETFRKYWAEVPLEEREAAKQRFLDRKQSQ